jgi:hypothetical protein
MQSTVALLSDAELDNVTGGAFVFGNGNGAFNRNNGSGNGSDNGNLTVTVADNLVIGGSVSTGGAFLGHSGGVVIVNNS